MKPLKGLEVAFEYTFDKTWSNQNVNKASIDYTTVELAKIQTATTSSLETTHQSTDYNAINCMLIIDIHGMTHITCH